VTRDRVLEAFLLRQREEGLALAAQSDLLDLFPLGAGPAARYLTRFSCTGLVRSDRGEIDEAAQFEIGVWFPPDYLRRAEPWQVLTWLAPRNVFHPNINGPRAAICVGRIQRGMPLVDLLYQCFEVITYQKRTVREDDALDADACVWARAHEHRLPVDRRPLKWVLGPRPSALGARPEGEAP